MFRPELMDLGSRPSPTRKSLYAAAFFMVSEFGAGVLCCSVVMGRSDNVTVADIRIILLPLILYDFITFNLCGLFLRRQRAMLLPSERVLREFHLVALLFRGIGLLALCLASFNIPPILRGFVVVLAYGGTYFGLLVLNNRGPKSNYVGVKIQLWDLPIFIFVVQVWLRMDHYNTWSWSFTFWPIYLLATIAGICSVFGCISASTCSTRTLWQAIGVISILLFWMLHGLVDFLNDAGKVEGFAFPLLLLSLLLFIMSMIMAINYVDQRQEEDDEYVALDDDVEGPPLRRDESVFLEAVSATFYKSVSDLPNRIREWFHLGDNTTTADEEMQALTVRPFRFETCNICCDHDADAVFLHCGHGGVCHQCATFLFHRSGECCICRASVQGVAKITHMDTVAEIPTDGKPKSCVTDEKESEEKEAKEDDSEEPASDSAGRAYVKARTIMAR